MIRLSPLFALLLSAASCGDADDPNANRPRPVLNVTAPPPEPEPREMTTAPASSSRRTTTRSCKGCPRRLHSPKQKCMMSPSMCLSPMR